MPQINADFFRLICEDLRRKAPRSEMERVLRPNQSRPNSPDSSIEGKIVQ
jgi:hypothetical protein